MKTSLDYERKKEYSFKVVAKDGGNATAEATVTIYVTDVNDHEPRFDKNPYIGSVKENLNTNHLVDTVRATDADSGQLGSVTYSIIAGNIGNAFTINAQGRSWYKVHLAVSNCILVSYFHVSEIAIGQLIERESQALVAVINVCPITFRIYFINSSFYFIFRSSHCSHSLRSRNSGILQLNDRGKRWRLAGQKLNHTDGHHNTR